MPKQENEDAQDNSDEEAPDGVPKKGRAEMEAPLVTGCRCRIHGLKAAGQLNGLIGKAIEYNNETGRWTIEFENKEKKNIKVENLKPLPPEKVVPKVTRERCIHWGNFMCAYGDQCKYSHDFPGGSTKARGADRLLKGGHHGGYNFYHRGADDPEANMRPGPQQRINFLSGTEGTAAPNQPQASPPVMIPPTAAPPVQLREAPADPFL
jgi:hypothetical protein